jgi:hypothetical protein
VEYSVVVRRTGDGEGSYFVPSELGDMLSRQDAGSAHTQQRCQVEIYFLNTALDREEFNRFRSRYGRDITQFFFLNDCAVRACAHFNIPIATLSRVEDLPEHTGVALRHLFAYESAASAGGAGGLNTESGPMAAKS